MTLEYLTTDNLEETYGLVQSTIKACYPEYYAPGVVEFFCRHHSRENIAADMQSGKVYGIYHDDVLAGTGTIDGNHITRVFVKPEFQGRGYGSYIFNLFENRIFDNFNTVVIDASRVAEKMYDKRGYKKVSKEEIDCQNGSVLVYDVMEKNR